MVVIVDGKRIDLPDSDVIIARNSVNSFLSVVRKGCDLSENEALYLTTLVMMYKKSTELLNELGVDKLCNILEEVSKQQ